MSLPDSWRETTVGNVVVDLQPGFAQKPGEENEGTTAQIRTHNVSPKGKITLEGIKHVSASDRELEKYRLVVGDVLFNNTNSEEWVGKTAVFDQQGEYVFSNHMTRLRVNRELILPEYLASYLHLLWAQGYSKTRAKRWVSQAGIEGAALASFKLPLPTLPEQHRIVDMLRQAEMISDLRKNAQVLVDQLCKQRFVEMFGHPAENPKAFECLPFQDFGTLDRGISKHRPRDASHLYGGPYPFIQTGNVSNAGDWITTYKATYSEAGLAQSKLWPKGTLCITIAANIAKAAILEFDACFPDSVVGFIPAEGISSEYVLYCLRFYQEFFEHRAPKSAQMNINLETLRTLRIPKPPETMQREFAEFVREVRLLNQAATAQTEKQSEFIDELRIATFTGELTDNWRETMRVEIETAIIERDQILRKRGAKVSVRSEVLAPPERIIDFSKPARRWLLDELSEFQGFVLNAMHERKGTLLADNVSDLDEFCRLWPVEHERNIHDRVKRALEQLAALGLIAKVALPNGNGDFVAGYRPLRPEEKSRLNDISLLQASLENGNSEAGETL